MERSPYQCIVVLGGSFDPVHIAHVAMADIFVHLLKATQLRIIPTGNPWHKTACRASAEQRIAMLSIAFARLANSTSLFIDTQEVERAKLGIPSYSVDTLAQLREEVGPAASLVFLIGADQLQQLQHWKNWQQLFKLAHIAVAARPGFTLNAADNSVAAEFNQRAGTIEQLKNRPAGCTYLYRDLSIDISSTHIRNRKDLSFVPPDVLSYIQQHHLY